MNITIHRGTREIGGSCVELNNRQATIVIDMGMPLVEKDGSRFESSRWSSLSGEELVIKVLLPAVPGFYAWDLNTSPIDGLFLSHAHMDHYGFSSFIRSDVPVTAENPQDVLWKSAQNSRHSMVVVVKPNLLKRECPYNVDHSK